MILKITMNKNQNKDKNKDKNNVEISPLRLD
jgi:hypothetical protein